MSTTAPTPQNSPSAEAAEVVRSVSTLAEAFQATVARIPDETALRTLDGETTFTFAEYGERVRSIAAGLSGLGVKRGDTFCLLLLNRPEFHLVDTAAMHLGATCFSLYATAAPDQIAYQFGHAQNNVVVTEQVFLPLIQAARAQTGGKPEHVIVVDGPAEGALSLAEVEAGRAGVRSDFDFDATWRAVTGDDVLTLIYTSGTTGQPKGVELTHAGTLAQWRGLAEVLPLRLGGSVISYLPAAHIADRSGIHYAQMLLGFTVTSVADPRQIAAALPQVRPTAWGAVPRVAEKLKAAIEANVAADPDEAKRTAIQGAIATGVEVVRHQVAGQPVPAELAARHAAAEEHVLSGLRAMLGLDRVEWVMFGSAPLPLDVHEFIRGIGIPTLEVYGMSESSMCATAYSTTDHALGTVGRAIPGVELKLAEDGEVLLKGGTLMKGYKNEPEKTAEAIDAEGWLHTGDIGQLDDEGWLKIVDRKKEIIINAAGKNMSPALIEGHLKAASPLIGQATVIGDGRRYNVALLVLDPDVAAVYAERNGLADGSVAAVAADPGVQAGIAQAVEAANAKLSRVEQVKRYTLLAEEWMPGGVELTPTMKLKRKPIAAKYADTIEALYAEAE
ncbi:MAG: long-chain fatty acid--CoA ligase [Solirubrobacteraceae bacterium]|nr:long-chain fatty acid--CoA ligase [Solirubrobacteraceae bacterium]